MLRPARPKPQSEGASRGPTARLSKMFTETENCFKTKPPSDSRSMEALATKVATLISHKGSKKSVREITPHCDWQNTISEEERRMYLEKSDESRYLVGLLGLSCGCKWSYRFLREKGTVKPLSRNGGGWDLRIRGLQKLQRIEHWKNGNRRDEHLCLTRKIRGRTERFLFS
jgi:hypothetical protein